MGDGRSESGRVECHLCAKALSSERRFNETRSRSVSSCKVSTDTA